jgi:hypothetical protein
VYKEASKKYNLSRTGRLSIYDGCVMRIYRDDLLIIVVKTEDQDKLYECAALELERYMKLHKYIDRKGR